MTAPETLRRLGEALMEAGPALAKLSEETLSTQDHPLTYRQYRALSRVEGGIDTVAELARSAGVSPPTMSASVDTLVRRGLLSRTDGRRDRRCSPLSLASAGRHALESARGSLAQLGATLARELSSELEAGCLEATTHALEMATHHARELRHLPALNVPSSG